MTLALSGATKRGRTTGHALPWGRRNTFPDTGDRLTDHSTAIALRRAGDQLEGSVQIPFSLDDFLGVFVAYHRAVPLAPLVALGIAAWTCWLVVRRRRAAAWLWLAVLWAWMGGAYHLVFFARINPAARLFGAAFLAQAMLFLWLAHRERGMQGPAFRWRSAGPAIVMLALVVYPLAGHALGQRYPALPTFGLPCPTTIFTLGVIAWTRPPRWVLAIPVLWALVGTSAALQLGMWQDLLLPASAVLAVWSLRAPAPPVDLAVDSGRGSAR